MVDPNDVKAKALKLEKQNLKFRTFLKSSADDDELDAQFLKLHEELFAGYDCCKCANCCKEYRTLLDDKDVGRIASFLGMTEKDFVAMYLDNADPDDGKPYKTKNMPCAFLCDDGRCKIQDVKPDDCTEFPYTDHPDRLSSMYGVIEFAEVCPVVFEIIERLKAMYGFHDRA